MALRTQHIRQNPQVLNVDAQQIAFVLLSDLLVIVVKRELEALD